MRVRGVAWALMVVACAGPDREGAASGASTGSADTVGDGSVDRSDEPSGDADATGAACGDPQIECAGACIDPQSDPEHCGGCGNPCGDGLACVAGRCGVACGELELCDGACTDTSVSPLHCGQCGTACGAGEPCVAGQCAVTCGALESVCGGACVDPTHDEANCGGCDSPCGAGSPCVYGECVTATIHHVLGTGQSLSVGATNTVVSTEQPFENISFNTGVRAGSTNLVDFIPLVETQGGSEGETIASGMANLATELAEASGFPGLRILASAHGVSGTPYSGLSKGTAAYAAAMAQVQAGASVAAAAGESYRVRAVTVIHGESDHIGANLGYDADLLEWQSDYEADTAAITGTRAPLPMFLCQMSSHTAFGSATSVIPGLQLEAARQRPDRIFVVGPKYFLAYTDGVHLTGESTRWLGEYYAKVYRQVLVDGEPWLALSPRAVSRQGAAIRIEFNVPAPPLVFDEVAVANPGNFGFDYVDSSALPPSIVRVMLDGGDAVIVTLSEPPIAGNRRIRYAYTGVAGQPAGPMTGARGNLRDSDATESRFGYDLSNWTLHFDEPVP